MVPAIRAYRNNRWLTANEHRAFNGIVSNGQWLYVDPSASMVIAKFSSQPLAIDADTMDTDLRVFHASGMELAGRLRVRPPSSRQDCRRRGWGSCQGKRIQTLRASIETAVARSDNLHVRDLESR
jgi:hypothetical protein